MLEAITGIGLFTTIALIAAYIYKRYQAAIQVAVLAQTRANRIKQLDAEQQTVNTEVQTNEKAITDYERDYGVKLVHPTDSGNGSEH